MIFGWLPQTNASGFWTHIGSSVSGPWNGSVVSSVIRGRASSHSCGGQKNTLRRLWPAAQGLVRPQDPPGSRPVVRRYSRLLGAGGSAGRLTELRAGEARTAGLPGRQPPVHETLRLLCGQAGAGIHHPGRGPGAEARLAHGQGAGEAVHARPA